MEETERSTSQDSSRFIGGLIVGGVIGSLLTLVALGSKDEKVKREVRRKVKELVKELPRFIEGLEEKGEEIVTEVAKGLPSGKKKK